MKTPSFTIALVVLGFAHPSAGQAPPQTFKLSEHFGVSHPQQVVELALTQAADPAMHALRDESGINVPWQLLAGGKRIAVSVDLPANSNKTLKLVPGRTAAAKDAVIVDERHPEYIEISNGLTGVRVPKVYAPLRVKDLKSPFQGIRFRDGNWSAAGKPLLFGDARYEEGIPEKIDAMTVKFIERGPVVTTVEVGYSFNVKPWPGNPSGHFHHPGGPAHYRLTFTIQQGEPSILGEVDTDYMSATSVDFYEAVKPTVYRYRGHRSDDPKLGREADGSRYSNQDHDHDCQPIPINYSKNTFVSQWAPGMGRLANEGDESRMGVDSWNPWQSNGGWVASMYQEKGAPNSNTVSLFAGAASRLIAGSFATIGFHSGKATAAGITLITETRSASNRYALASTPYKTIRYPFGIFVGTRQADMPDDVFALHTALRQHVRHSNGLNLNKLLAWNLEFPDPKTPFGGIFMPAEAVSRLAQRCRDEESFYQHLRSASPDGRDIWDMWRDASGKKAREMAADVNKKVAGYVEEWANGGGYFSCKYTTQNWLLPAPLLERIDLLLGSEHLDEKERAQLKASAALLGNWLWDYDAYPLKSERGRVIAGVNMGSPNMPLQWTGIRNLFTWFLNSHPVIASHLAETAVDLPSINDNGASNACPHYAGTVTPLLNIIMRRTVVGHDDWKSEPKLRRFAEWYMHMLTPPEVRFGGHRVLTVDGDAEACDRPTLLGELGTVSHRADPDLSARLMGIWAAVGKPHHGFYGNTVLRIDEALPTADARLGNAAFPGYGAVLRSGWNTPEETSIHAINGDYYRDHRHGSSNVAHIYALGAPLSLAFETMYTPRTGTSFLKSGVLPEATITAAGRTWNGEMPRGQDGFLEPGDPWNWDTQRQEDFQSFSQSACSRLLASTGKDLVWSRQIASIHPDPSHPLILIADRFSGEGAGQNLVFSMNQMATGVVQTPAGPVTPEPRFFEINNPSNQQAPSGGKSYELKPGLQRFAFTGEQFGKAGTTPAIDWDLYGLTASPHQFAIGHWGHDNASQGSGLFSSTNGRSYAQRQHILRVKGSGGFTHLIVPRRKGTAAPVVTGEGTTLAISLEAGVVRLNEHGYTLKGKNKTVVTTFDATPNTIAGLTLSGGPTEAVYDHPTGHLLLTAHGSAGTRKVGLPAGTWKTVSGPGPNAAVSGNWDFEYGGGKIGETPAAVIVLTRTR